MRNKEEIQELRENINRNRESIKSPNVVFSLAVCEDLLNWVLGEPNTAVGAYIEREKENQ